jgi:hypothetical protein
MILECFGLKGLLLDNNFINIDIIPNEEENLSIRKLFIYNLFNFLISFKTYNLLNFGTIERMKLDSLFESKFKEVKFYRFLMNFGTRLISKLSREINTIDQAICRCKKDWNQ